MDQRIIGEKVDLDYTNVREFFDRRGENKQLGSKYNYVLYQDDCPELAVKILIKNCWQECSKNCRTV